MGAIGAVLFGAGWGFVYVWIGAMAGASAAFFIGTLKEVWAGGNWAQLFSWKAFFSVALFVFSLFIPPIIKRLKGEGHLLQNRKDGAEGNLTEESAVDAECN